ncbi:hypothetical protein J6590_058244 [Homalodisca vitripennis]|nr:hypothetical protein J6590_058244 [Homalodisca vitripennis]
MSERAPVDERRRHAGPREHVWLRPGLAPWCDILYCNGHIIFMFHKLIYFRVFSRYGRVNVLRWMKDADMPALERTCNVTLALHYDATSRTAMVTLSSLNVLRWMKDADMPALERTCNGALALHYAAARGCLDCVRLLVDASSDLRSRISFDFSDFTADTRSTCMEWREPQVTTILTCDKHFVSHMCWLSAGHTFSVWLVGLDRPQQPVTRVY